MEDNKEYTLAEKEAIIAQKVADFKFPEGRIFFYMNGEGATRIMRDFWQSDLVSQAIKFGTEGLGMSEKYALKICTGKHMLIGDSRIESYPGGIEGVEDDGRYDYEAVSVEKMVIRLERIFISGTALANACKRDLEYLLPLPTAAGYEARGPFRYGTGEGAEDKRRLIEDYETKAKKALAGLATLYPLIGKTIADLPISKIQLALSDMEKNFVLREWAKFEASSELKEKKQDLDEKMDEVTSQIMAINNERLAIELAIEDSVEEPEEAILLPVPEDMYDQIGSCWITPEGKMFGGPAEPWIHIEMLRKLTDDGYFKDLPYDGEDEDTVEENGWIKLSGGYGFMLYPHKAAGYVISEEQKQVVIDWCIANKEKSLQFNGHNVDLKDFVNMSCTDIMTI